MTETGTIDSSNPPPNTEEATLTISPNEDLPMLDVQNPKSPSDSDSDSDSDSETQQNLQIQTLESQLSDNPLNYDAHVQYIRALRKQGDIDKLRKAREAMSDLFPLSLEMWQEWIKDETTLSSGSEVFPAIEKLYERGVSDYLSVSLWCDYIKFVQGCDPAVREGSPTGISKMRALYERALTAAGLDIVEGSRIWQSYREFEHAIIPAVNETNFMSREKQIQSIRNVFHRQLSVPLSDLRSTLLTYKAWEAEQGNALDVSTSDLNGISSHVASTYQKALEMLDARAHFEEQICRQDAIDSERIQEFMTYIQFEQSSGDPARVQILYERAITNFPISSDLWLDYTRYMDKTLKSSSILKDIYYRATRNCSWVGELWVGYLLSLERGQASEKDISAVFEKSLQCTFSNIDEYLDIFLTRVDGLRRRNLLTGAVEDALDYAVIRDTFQRASDYLSPHLKNSISLLQMYHYWARLESSLGKDLAAARGVWEGLLKISSSMLEAWQGYIAMEIEMGHINEARSLYKRCYSKRFPGTGSEDICHLWLRFEREFGLLEDYDHAVQKVTPRLEDLRLFKLQQESKNSRASTDQREDSFKKNAREKRKAVPKLTDEQSPPKKHKDRMQNKEGYEKDKAQAKNSFDEVQNAKNHVGKPQRASGNQTKDTPDKFERYNDQCTAFISNLSLEATYEDLCAFFSDVGGVVDIRILLNKLTQKSRGLAYVDFSDEAHLAAAVAKNKQSLLGKSLSIARSDPTRSIKRPPVGRSTRMQFGKMARDGDERSHAAGKSDSTRGSVETSKESGGVGAQSADHGHRDDSIQLKGKNTFAVPRAVRPLGWIDKSKNKAEGSEEGGDEKPKSNDEFRKMFLRA